MRVMSARESVKSNLHRKAHGVESGGAARKFTRLTRGGLGAERPPEVSRGHSSVDADRKVGGAKGRRIRSGGQPPDYGSEARSLSKHPRTRNYGEYRGWRTQEPWWIQGVQKFAASESPAMRKEGSKDDA